MLRKAKQPLIYETIRNWKRLRIKFLKKQLNQSEVSKFQTKFANGQSSFQKDKQKDENEDDYQYTVEDLKTYEKEQGQESLLKPAGIK